MQEELFWCQAREGHSFTYTRPNCFRDFTSFSQSQKNNVAHLSSMLHLNWNISQLTQPYNSPFTDSLCVTTTDGFKPTSCPIKYTQNRHLLSFWWVPDLAWWQNIQRVIQKVWTNNVPLAKTNKEVLWKLS